MAEFKRGGPTQRVAIRGPRLDQVGAAAAFGRQVDAPRGPDGQRLVDSLNTNLQDDTFYGSGRQQQKFGQPTTRLPLTEDFYRAVNAQVGRSEVGLPYGNGFYVSVDNQTGDLPVGLGSADHMKALASGATDAGVAYVGRVKVGSQTYAEHIKNGVWDEKTEAAAVALGMILGGQDQADNLRKAGFQVKFVGGQLDSYTPGNRGAVRAKGVKSGSKRLNGSFGFAMRANQQANYWQGGETPQGRANLAQRLATDRGADGLVNTPGAFPLNKNRIQKVPGQRGYRTGIVFTPRDAMGRPVPNGDLYNKDYQCRVENSGPGISDFTDNQGNASAGFRLFPRRNKKSGSVSCGYSPDIFVNTTSSSYTQGGRRVMQGNDLASELDRRGAGALGAQLDRNVADLTANRQNYYGRSLKKRGGNMLTDAPDKMQAWADRQGIGL